VVILGKIGRPPDTRLTPADFDVNYRLNHSRTLGCDRLAQILPEDSPQFRNRGGHPVAGLLGGFYPLRPAFSGISPKSGKL
jgi:hypothetical protein